MPDPIAPPADRPTNRLAAETSPYLLQHAHNPVDWYPWGPEALTRAKFLDRPIFLSIGYAACHWCHVMERESFEDDATADVLNARFIPVKVDREERPDLDQVYMAAVVAMTGHGGWPMSVFLTPEGRPFYGGTYYPNVPRHGLPSFVQILEGVDRAWREQRGEIEAAGARLVDAVVAQQRLPVVPGAPTPAMLDASVENLAATFDAANGGWGDAPKFPQPMTLEFLLRRAAAGDDRALGLARRSLDAMADGGLRDQLGGGFHRYSVDAIWLVPHFEQMLYDNAQLARVYLQAFALTGDRRYRDVGVATLDALRRDFTTGDGAFAASLDADTDGEEGLTYTWTPAELREVLDATDADLVARAYGVTEAGNFEGRSILSRLAPTGILAAELGLDGDEVERRLGRARERLLERRAGRAQPGRDDKALAAWNGLAILAFAEGAMLLEAAEADDAIRARFVAAAVAASSSLLDGLWRDGRLARSWKDGRATASGILEDHANLAIGLLTLHEATGEERWFVAARALGDAILERFADPAGGFFDTASDHERLVARPKELQDNAVPSGGSMAARALLRLGALTGDARYDEAAERAIAGVAQLAVRYPGGFANWLSAIDWTLADTVEVAVILPADGDDPERLVQTARGGFRPNRVVAVSADPAGSAVPLLEGRTLLDGRAAAYVCRDFACRMPVSGSEALRADLSATSAT